MVEAPQPCLVLNMEARRLAEFLPLLRQGFSVTVRVGCSLEDLLCRQWGIAPDYVAKRITTIFLNSKAVDDLTSAVVRDGAVIALSGAMPGLVGATMRRGGYYAALRGTITHHESAAKRGEDTGSVRIKLFNLLMAELGPGFLLRGVLLAPAALINFLAGQPPAFWEECRAVRLNGRPVDAGRLLGGGWLNNGAEAVRLTVLFEE